MLAANPHWRGSRGNVGEVTIERVPPKVYVEWRAGRDDILLVGPHHVDDLRGQPDTLVLPIPLLSTRYVAFPARPPFDDVRIRKALAHALDRDLLVRETDDQPAQGGFLPPAMPGHTHDLAPSHDLARARSLLAEAGHPEGRGLPELRLIHSGFGFSEAFRRKVEARFDPQWRELGVRVRQEWEPIEAVVSERNANGSFWAQGWHSDYPDPHGMLGTFLEWGPVGSDELQLLLSRARSRRSRDERLQLYRDADRRLVAEQTWVVPTIYPTRYLIHRP